jgi:hypothetical protein
MLVTELRAISSKLTFAQPCVSVLLVHTELKIGEYHLDLIPFDKDILSLELQSSFRECYMVRIPHSSSSSSFFKCRRLTVVRGSTMDRMGIAHLFSTSQDP